MSDPLDDFLKERDTDPDAAALDSFIAERSPGTRQTRPMGSDAGPSGRRAASGMAPGPRPPAPEETEVAQGSLGPTIVNKDLPPFQKDPNANNPFAQDWLANTIATGLVAGGAGKAVTAGAEALGLPAVGARILGGAGGGATASTMEGGSPVTGALLGGGLSVLGEIGGAWLTGALKRTNERLFQDYGQAGGKASQAKLMRIGPEDVGATVRRYGINKNDPAVAQVATKDALANVGSQIGDSLKVIDQSGGEAPLGDVITRLTKLQDELGRSTEGAKLASKVADKIAELHNLYGKSGTIPASALNKEIGDLQTIGYSGAGVQLSPMAGKTLARRMAGAMDEVLAPTIAKAAKSNPLAEQAAKDLLGLNKDYRVLKTLDPIIEKQALADRFQKSLAERLIANPVKTVVGGMAKAPVAAGRAVASGVDNALAKLMFAARQGNVPPDLVDEALRSGANAEIVAQIAARGRQTQPPLVPMGAQ